MTDFLNESFRNRWLGVVSHVTSSLGFLMYTVLNPKDNYDMSASVFVVQFNGFMLQVKFDVKYRY